MRKDVKIGLGIGGVLLAVLIVYLLVPKTDDRGGIARSDDSALPTEDGAATSSGGSSDLISSQAGGQTGRQGEATSTEPARETPTQTPDQGAGQATNTSETGGDPASPPTKRSDWDTILATGIVPEDARIGLVAQNPPTQTEAHDIFAPESGKSAEPDWGGGAQGATRTNPGVTPPTGATPLPAGTNGQNGTPPGTPPGASNGSSRAGIKEHVVQQGENLSMIAAVAYGDAKHYREILKANPNVDERKLRPGTVLKMPDAATFAAPKAQQAAAQQAAARQEATPVDGKTEYRIQQGDSLEKIAVKLYGKPTKWESLYQANREKIGDDSSRLKLGMVLKLPEPPTATR